MKRISNYPAKVAAAGSLLSIAGLLLTPVSSLALNTKSTASTTPKSSPFCTNLTTKTTTITTSLGDLTAKVTQAQTAQDQKQAAAWQQVDQKVSSARTTADSARLADFTKLEAKATTDVQKQAVTTYEAAVHTAVVTRRASADSARQTFRSGVQAAVSARRATVTTQLNSFQGSVDSAITTAQASCASDPSSGPAVRLALQASLKTAHQTFQAGRKTDTAIDGQIKQLAVARNSAFTTAQNTFQASLTTARQSLKVAFGKSANTVQ